MQGKGAKGCVSCPLDVLSVPSHHEGRMELMPYLLLDSVKLHRKNPTDGLELNAFNNTYLIKSKT